jgi:hypothetical protein
MRKLNNEITFFLCLDIIVPTYFNKMHFLTICSKVLQRWNNVLNSYRFFLGFDFFQNNNFNLKAPNHMGTLSLNNTNTHITMDNSNINNNSTICHMDHFKNPWSLSSYPWINPYILLLNPHFFNWNTCEVEIKCF